MKQKEFKKLKVGDKVQIVNLEKFKRCAARNRVMDKWAGEIVTVLASKFEAKCNPKDTYDFAKGAKVAFDRLFEK